MNLLSKAKNLVTVPKVDVGQEMMRRKSQRLRILDLLKSGKDVTTVDLQRIAFNYTMRISELRKDGHQIESYPVKPGLYRYVYGGQK